MATRGSEGSDHEVSPGGSSSFRPHLKTLNVEVGAERFIKKDGDYGPTIATWRSNLVASSQRRNLLFTAHGHQIYTWIPGGPFQVLGSTPEMIINPVMSNTRAAGYIDPSSPHTINHMLVDDLGRDEILVLATDSGNICAYHVEAIYSAISRCTVTDYKRPFNDAEVIPFFTESVGRSAWGLAVHKYARMIAVSCNTFHITVFAFALTDGVSGGRNDDHFPQMTWETTLHQSDSTWVHIDDHSQFSELKKMMPHSHRVRNLRITYKGHLDNIPCVSFANFDLDPNGNTMCSTDIHNQVLIWDLWSDIRPIRSYFPGNPMNSHHERGWTVMPLDPRTFKRHHALKEACGCRPASRQLGSRSMLDLTSAIETVPDTSQIFNVPSDEFPRSVDDGFPHICSPAALVTHGTRESHGSGSESKPSESGGTSADSGSPDPGASSSDMQSDPKSERGLYKLPPVILRKQRLPSLFDEDNAHSRSPSIILPAFEDLNLELWDGYPAASEMPIRHPKSPTSFPVLHLSEHHISLAPYPLDSDYHLLCNNALFQNETFFAPINSACDRFNMVKYVPELSLVVAASQKGRIVILSLTWHQDKGFMFRPDWIVPLLSQEARDERPMIPLLGITVSPMPGFEVPPDVPTIPLEQDDISFKYRSLDIDDDKPPSPVTSEPITQPSKQEPKHETGSHEVLAEETKALDGSASESNSGSQGPEKSEESPSKTTPRRKSLAERHAQASAAHRPRESWHGLHPSRHYRLLLYYCDNTVLSYEFWHDWTR